MKIIYNHIRKKLAEKLAGNNGKCEIYEDKIICHVNEEKLKKNSNGPYGYNIIFSGVKIPYKKYHKTTKILSRYERLSRKYDLDKPIYYVIEGVTFYKKINFLMTLKNHNIVLKNCTFHGKIFIDFMDKIIFINNKYKAYENSTDPFVSSDEFTIRTAGNKNDINKIEFIEDNIAILSGTLKLHLDAKSIHMSNTSMQHVSEINLNTDSLVMEESNITTTELKLNSQNIAIKESTIFAEQAVIDTTERSLEGINSKCIIVIDREGQKAEWSSHNQTAMPPLDIVNTPETNIKSHPIKKVLKK